MSNYTKLEQEVTFMDTSDRIEYECDLLQHDVEKNIEMSYGLSGLTNPKSITANFKDPKKIGLAILTLLIFLLTLFMVLFVIIYLLCIYKGDIWLTKRDQLEKLSIPMVMILLLLLLFYFIYNKFYGEIISLVVISKDNKVSKSTDITK